MANNFQLEVLSLLELNVMLEHVRLGKEHLKKHLSDKQLKCFLQLGELKTDQHQQIKSDHVEKFGQVALVANTIFTCAFGTWLGVAGFLGLGIGPKLGLITAAVVSFFVSVYFGYENYKVVVNQARTAIVQQKLNNLELKLLKIITNKRQKITDDIINYLNTSLKHLNKGIKINELHNMNFQCTFATHQEIEDFLDMLNQVLRRKIAMLQENDIYDFYQHELKSIVGYLKKTLSSNVQITEEGEKNNTWQLKKPQEHDEEAFIKILTNPTIASPRAKIKNKSWLRNNFMQLAIGLIPTILGGFGSLFVYFGGIPTAAKEFGFEQIEKTLSNPTMKIIALIVALVITAYFGISYIHSNRKAFKRAQEIDKMQTIITNQEANTIEVDAKLNFLRKLKIQMRKINFIFQVVDKVKVYLDKNQAKLSEYEEAYMALKHQLTELKLKAKVTVP